MIQKELHDFCLSFPHSYLDFPFGDKVGVYKIKSELSEDKMFALVQEKSDPLRLSLKCDPRLATVLRERYESVLEGYHLNKKHWNTLLLTGQLTDEEVKDLIVHSYNLVSGAGAETPRFD